MILKAILCVQRFCSFGAMLFIVKLLMKTDSTVLVFLVCLSMFVMIHFLFKNVDLKGIFCLLLEICVLSEIHSSKT